MAQPTDFATLEPAVTAMDGYRPKGPFPLFIKDLKEDTIGWEDAARWRYLCVLEHMFHQGGYIPDDLPYLAEISGTNRARNWRETLEKLRYILLKSDEKPGFLTNKRVLIEVVKANKRSGIASKGGKAKADKKAADSTKPAVLPTPTPKEGKKEGNQGVSQERKSAGDSPDLPGFLDRRTPEKPPAGAKPKPKRKSQLAPSWSLSPELRRWAKAKAHEAGVEIDWDGEADQFADHHRKCGTIFADWEAAWRTWTRNAVKYKLEKTHGNQHRGNRKSPSAHHTAYAAHAQAAGVPAGRMPGEDGPAAQGAAPDGNGAVASEGLDPGVPRLSRAR